MINEMKMAKKLAQNISLFSVFVWKTWGFSELWGLISPHYFHFPSSGEIFPRIILAITSPVNNLFPILVSGKIPIYFSTLLQYPEVKS